MEPTMQYIAPTSSVKKVLCCQCGISIDPNPTSHCIGCLRTKSNIAENFLKSATLAFCKGCERYLDPPSNWIKASLESKELLRLCLKKIKGLNQIRLVDAKFVWTESHSKRIKVKLTVQKELHSQVIIQQEFVTEFIVQNQFCSDCHKVEAKDYWNSLVQVRQKTGHKRTFLYLEQLILKHKYHEQAVGIKPAHGGLNFFFATDQGAHKMLDFLTSVIPCKWEKSKKLKSHDMRSNIYHYQLTYSVEIVPICREDLVCLSPNLANHLGSISQLCLIRRVTSCIFLIDPTTAQMAEVTNTAFWQYPFKAICSSRQLKEFTVIDINDSDFKSPTGKGKISHKHKICEAWVQRSSDLGKGDSIFCRSHLGLKLKHGDRVLGYDLKTTNANDSEVDKLDSSDLPDIILVKKVYGDRTRRNRRRKWKLKHLDLKEDTSSQNRDYVDFLEDLEEDPLIRTNVNIYRKGDRRSSISSTTPSEFEDAPEIAQEEMLEDAPEIVPEEVLQDAPEVALEEMLQDLNVADSPDEEEDEAWESASEEVAGE